MATSSGLGLIVAAVQHTWDLSVAVLPVLFIVLFAYYLFKRRDDGSIFELMVSGQRDITMAYSTYLVAGFILGGILNLFLGVGLLPGVAVVAVALIAAAGQVETPEPVSLTLNAVSEYLHLFWAAVLVYAALTTVFILIAFLTPATLGRTVVLMESVLAIVFYAAVFWEL